MSGNVSSGLKKRGRWEVGSGAEGKGEGGWEGGRTEK